MDGSECVFLTGASGFFGGYLLRELSARNTGGIVCLVRGNSRQAAEARLKRALVRHGHAHLLDQVGGRIRVVAGDLAKGDLGLSAPDRAMIAAACDHFLHNGAEISLTKSAAQLHAANVEAVSTLLGIAGEVRLRPVTYISSYSVLLAEEFSGRVRVGEAELPTDPRSLDCGYQQTKLQAEHILREARRAGVPVTVFRPDFLVGDSATGHWPFGDLITIVARAALELGRAPRSDARVSGVPVDIVAEAVIRVLADGRHLGQDFNLVPNGTYTFVDFFSALQGSRYELELSAPDQWLTDVRTSFAHDPVIAALMPLIGRVFGTGSAGRKYRLEIDNGNLRGALGEQAKRLDWLGQDIVLRYLDQLVEAGRIDPPARRHTPLAASAPVLG